MTSAGKHALVAVVLSSGLGLLVASCGGSSSDASSSARPAAEAEAAPVEAVSGKDKKHGGWRWKGARRECFFVFDNECFATRKAACRAAGCGLSSCQQVGQSAPAKIRCAKR
jgi:hypothetical protein